MVIFFWFLCLIPFSLFSAHAPTLRLEVEIKAKQPFYVGQRAQFIYRIYYNENIDLTKEDLPLIEPEGFSKVGPLKVKDYLKDGMNVNEITQEVQAKTAGTFTFPISVIEGKSYHSGFGDKKIYEEPILHSEVPAQTIIVEDFAKPAMPASFSGAIGTYTLDVKMLTPSKVYLGDPVKLSISLSGKGILDELTLPNISCQPGFSGFFHVNRVPLDVTLQNGVKTFTIELRPITSLVKAVPSIEFASLNPDTNSYQVVSSKPIPLEVELPPSKEKSTASVGGNGGIDWSQIAASLPPLTQPTAIPLKSRDFNLHLMNFWLVFGVIVMGALMFLFRSSTTKKIWIVAFLLVGTNQALSAAPLDTLLREGNESYQKALQATTVAARQEGLNQALSHYLEAEKSTDPQAPAQGYLDYNIGNALLLLEDFPRAIAYYKRASLHLPRDTQVQKSLQEAQKKLGVLPAAPPSPFLDSLIHWYDFFNREELLRLWLLSVLVTFFVLGFYLFQHARVKGTPLILSLGFFLFCLWGVAAVYLKPLEVVAIHPLLLYQGPGEQYPLASQTPVLPGSLLHVADLSPDGKWVKITTDKNEIGYVPQHSLFYIRS